jgi:hypothetical protein
VAARLLIVGTSSDGVDSLEEEYEQIAEAGTFCATERCADPGGFGMRAA